MSTHRRRRRASRRLLGTFATLAGLGAWCATLAAHAEPQVTAAAPAVRSPADDRLAPFIEDMYALHGGRTLCLSPEWSTQQVRHNLIRYLVATGQARQATVETVARALWQLFPCPFSPYRRELRQATRHDILGTWVHPPRSQKWRLARGSAPVDAPARCEVVRLHENGAYRHRVYADAAACPLHAAAEALGPEAAAWRINDQGRLEIARAGTGEVETWDVYVVEAPFSWDDVAFEPGDLVAYLRRLRTRTVGAAVSFMHLRRLP
jgi:hypothetical protein